jgi:sirohydrochlorin cobaltochelatase
VAFGSSEDSAQVSFENIDKKVKSAYLDIPVRWACTSVIIHDKLAKQGKQLDSPEVALARMTNLAAELISAILVIQTPVIRHKT